jgi:hypothetical protein
MLFIWKYIIGLVDVLSTPPFCLKEDVIYWVEHLAHLVRYALKMAHTNKLRGEILAHFWLFQALILSSVDLYVSKINIYVKFDSWVV